ncbi:MAG: type II secretion system protein, partial [Chthoniobacterales bacterium]
PGADAKMDLRREHRGAFTLIELLVVITIIAILMGLLFPAFKGVQDQAKRTQAKNDVTQIVTAINAFYTEYGKYPLATDDTPISDNAALMNELRGLASQTQNPKLIVFFSPPDSKDPTKPRSGVGADGKDYDPWGLPYFVAIDGDYDNLITPNPYSSNAGSSPLHSGAIAWSLGKDGQGGMGDKNAGVADDDVISWQ